MYVCCLKFWEIFLSFTSLPHQRPIFLPHSRPIFPKLLPFILPCPYILEIWYFPTSFEIQKWSILRHLSLSLHVLTTRTGYPFSKNLQLNRTRLISFSFIIKVRIFLRFHYWNFFVSFFSNPTVFSLCFDHSNRIPIFPKLLPKDNFNLLFYLKFSHLFPNRSKD